LRREGAEIGQQPVDLRLSAPSPVVWVKSPVKDDEDRLRRRTGVTFGSGRWGEEGLANVSRRVRLRRRNHSRETSG
jgi:hypothetical protein